MRDRQKRIKSKGFAMNFNEHPSPENFGYQPDAPVDFTSLKVGAKKIQDAIIDLGDYNKGGNDLGRKRNIMLAIENGDIKQMVDISSYFYRTSGIYARLCRYMAYLYRYDWMVTPHSTTGVKMEKVEEGFYKALNDLDSFEVKKVFGEIALKVIVKGCYYGYVVRTKNKIMLQELPNKYCRTRFSSGGRPLVEFNLEFFDAMYTNVEQRLRVLKAFPKEFQQAYVKYKKGLLPPEYPGDSAGWWLLDIGAAVKFNLNGYDFPAFFSVIPAIVDLDDAQALDRRKMAQKLLKIIIQKMPIDKNGDLVFDVDEAQQLHNNAVNMLGRAVGIDVLTTFADVQVADMADKNTTTSVDDLQKVERTIYNEAGVSQMQFNTDGNIALEKSILNDEATLYNLIQQFECFLNDLLKPYNKNPKKLNYRVQILPTTIYNYKDLSKMYKEQTQLGYSKMLPQIALGQSQSTVLANAFFENDVLELYDVFIPPMMSSTMNGDTLLAIRDQKKNGGEAVAGESEAGRPELDNDQKSEKTIQNIESKG